MNHLRLFLCLVPLCFLLGCDTNRPSSDPEFIANIERIYLTRDWQHADELKASLDSLYLVYPNLSTLDKAEYYELQGWYYRTVDKRDSAILYIDSMLFMLTSVEDMEPEYVKALNTKALLLRAKGHYNEALKVLYAAGPYAEKNPNNCSYSHVLANLGAVLYSKGSYKEAVRYYKQALNAASNCDTTEYVDYFVQGQSVYNAIGLCHEKAGSLDSAVYYYQSALEFIQRMGPTYNLKHRNFIQAMRGVVLGNYANTLLKQGKVEQARTMFKESININLIGQRELGDGMFTLLKLGQLYLNEGQLDSAATVIEETQKYLNEYENTEVRQRLRKFTKRYYLLVGDSIQALRSSLAFSATADSLNKTEQSLEGISFNNTFELLEQKEELEGLRADRNRYRYYILFAVVLVIVLLSSAFVYRNSLRRSKRHAKDLRELNQEILSQHDRLQEAMNALEESHEEINRIMKVLAHDLRSPIGGMYSLSALMLEEEMSDEVKEYAEMVNQLSKDSLGFVDSLLNFKTATTEEEKRERDLLELINYCVRFLQLRADEKRQRITVEGVEVKAPIYREKVWRVINNIIGNAIKFSPKGAEIKILIKIEDKQAVVQVEDQGIGIPQDLKEKIFDVVTDAKRMGTDGEKAYGMGLAISRQIMELHGGKITVDSHEGRGSIFTLYFPASS